MEKLSDKCSQPPIMEWEWWTLRPFDGWNLWLEMDGGEGCTITKAEFMALLSGLWKRRF